MIGKSPRLSANWQQMARKFLVLALIAGLHFFLVSCAGSATTKPAQTVVPKPSEQVLIKQLLYEADEALRRDRLTSPAHDNAFDRFKKVLKVDPGNAQAKLGFKKIAQRYMKLANYADLEGDSAKAEHYRSMAKKIGPRKRPVRQEKAAQKTVQQAPANVYYLSSNDLKSRGAAIKARLNEIAKHARSIESRLLIVARNDAEGRWIYQQMREAVSGYRLRGNIEYAKRTKIILLDAPQ